MHGPPKMVDVMADMIQKGANAGNTGRAHSKGQVSNTITHLKTYMSLENLDSNFKGMARVLFRKNQEGEAKKNIEQVLSINTGMSMHYYTACNCRMCNVVLLGNSFHLFFNLFYVKIIFVLKNKVHIK